MSKVQDLRPVHNKFEIMERITTGCLGRAIAGDLQREVNVQVRNIFEVRKPTDWTHTSSTDASYQPMD